MICRRFGTWTVARQSGDRSGMVLQLQGPICNGTQVIGWHINNESDGKSKRFHAEMPGFAFNSTILWDPKRWHRPTLEPIRQLDSVKENLQVSNLVYLLLWWSYILYSIISFSVSNPTCQNEVTFIMCGWALFSPGSLFQYSKECKKCSLQNHPP